MYNGLRAVEVWPSSVLLRHSHAHCRLLPGCKVQRCQVELMLRPAAREAVRHAGLGDGMEAGWALRPFPLCLLLRKR